MSSRDSTRLLFSGKKCFWKSNITIDVSLIHHSPAQIIEVIAHDPERIREAPHLYVDEAVLLLALDSCSVVVNGSQSCAQVLDRAKVDCIFDGIVVVSSDLPESEHFEIEIIVSSYSCSDIEGLVIAKPIELDAYTSPFVPLNRGTKAYTPLSMRFPVSPACSTSCDQESPRAEDAMWEHLLTVTTNSPFEARERVCAAPDADQQSTHKKRRAHPGSPESVTDPLEPSHGVPKSAFCNTRVSTTSPNLSNTAGSDSVLTVPVPVPSLPLRLESVSTPCTPRDPSPQSDGTDSDPDLSVARGSPMIRAFGHTLISLSLMGNHMLRRGTSSLTESSSDEEGDLIGLPLDAHTATAKKSAATGRNTTPPVSARSSTNSESSTSSVHKAGYQRSRSYYLDKLPATLHISTTKAAAVSPRAKMLRMCDALGGSLRIPSWMTAAGGSSSKISPTVSTHVIDQLELEARSYQQLLV